MAPRQRFSVNFGGGLDRATGLMVVQPATFSDLRNVDLRAGRAEIRGPLKTSLDFADTDAVLAKHPIHSQGIGAAVTFNSTTGEVKLWLMSNDGTLNSLVGLIWTLPTGVSYPRVIVDDAYDKLFIAHDEGYYANRQQTFVFDPSAGTLAGLTADFDNDGTEAPVYFRGVRKYLSYMTGWGYGSEATLQGDRPEIVRISLPADPTHWVAEHYFVAGQRNEPVLACDPAGSVLAVRKANESYRIVGFSRTNFGIEPMDNEYGCVAGRLSLTVNGKNYFWSLEGPRVSDENGSGDLAYPLDVTGAVPDAKATEIDPAYGFAVYVPKKRQIWFVFGKWAYILSLATPSPEWSYHEFDVELMCGAVLYSIDTATLGPGAYPFFTAASAGYDPATDVDISQIEIGFSTSGTLVGDEHAEVWVRPRYGVTGWYKAGEVFPVLTVGNLFSMTVGLLGVTYDVAIRYREAGLYAPEYSAASPSLWPAASRGTFTSRIPHMTLELVGHARRSDATHWTQPFDAYITSFSPQRPNVATHPELRHKLEYSSDYVNGPWTLANDEAYDGFISRDSGNPITYDLKSYKYTLYSDWTDESYNTGPPSIEFRQAHPTNIALVKSGGHVAISWSNEDTGSPTSVDLVISVQVGAGAFTEIHRATYSGGAGIPATWTDTAPPTGSLTYRVAYETTAFATMDEAHADSSPALAFP